MKPTLCDTFRNLALRSWDLLSKGRSVGIQLGEESLTDLNLLELKIRHQSEIYSQTFTKSEESQNGSDWEWWFTGTSGKWIGFRVQAKIIEFKSDKFKHLHYKSKSDYQSNILIRSALDNKYGVKLIPLYCLYTNYASVTDWKYHKNYHFQESYGCSLISAFAVVYHRIMDIKKTRIKYLLPYINPWHELVCSHGYEDKDLPQRAWTYWKNSIAFIEEDVLNEDEKDILNEFDFDNEFYYGLKNENKISELQKLSALRKLYQNIELTQHPPDYVSQLMEGEVIEPPDNDIRTVTIFREGYDQLW
ncbi:DUF6615 family protein [Dendronalium sp. ChiSLP03b]|uniref:DUF6615 family protein n=1 Tax=Dendronalium sp. ChiSLP03b TaxID=3075381 RepID=UPI002AD2A230|nr:DUF6615 family protein [Dendronalium sp. ChiSLP03b]MDZ8207847.1 DUF6615 family protein [Dendronalium sp. ChiSLP03b]